MAIRQITSDSVTNFGVGKNYNVEKSVVTETARLRPESSYLEDRDTVTVSQDARLLSAVRQESEATPNVRADLVENLKIQVNNGTYKPDSRLIAGKMLLEEPGLFRL